MIARPAENGVRGSRVGLFRRLKRRRQWLDQRLRRLLARPWPDRFCLCTGPPRSGTTAVGAWFNSHPQVEAMTESRVLVAASAFMEQAERFNQLRRRPDVQDCMVDLLHDFYGHTRMMRGTRLLMDKEPLEPVAFPDRRYREFLDRVRKLIPGAKLLFMLRDPYATIWSMTQREWGQCLAGQETFPIELSEHIRTWCEVVDLIVEYRDDPDVYVCPFERLVQDPAGESERLWAFLGLDEDKPFEPRPVKRVNFSPEDHALIAEHTAGRVERLRSLGWWASGGADAGSER